MRFSLFLLVGFLTISAPFAHAQQFTSDCVVRGGALGADSLINLAAEETSAAISACSVIRKNGQFTVVGGVETLTSTKKQRPEFEQYCQQLTQMNPSDPNYKQISGLCNQSNTSDWFARCCALSL